MGNIELINCDCLQYMATLPDKAFDLAIVDPPYGIGASSDSRFGKFFTVHLNGKKHKYPSKDYKQSEWDNNAPPPEYFKELERISKHQIIWGANHFISANPKDSSAWVVWNKKNGESNGADCELAWTSFDSAVRMFEFKWNGMLQENMKNKEERLHPTQKPVALYKWLLKTYSDPKQKIIDTHLGSGSSAIAAYDFGCYFVGMEIDKDYFDAAVKRFNIHKMQTTLF